MTFSICVREPYENDEGESHERFGVAVTTRLAGVGTLCPFANEHGAVATQSFVNVDLGRKGISYLADGLSVDDGLEALLNADDGREMRQLHGVDSDGTFVFSGEECKDWYGHIEGDNYTVAGNLLTGESVIKSVAERYEETKDDDEPLAVRLASALEAGQNKGGDKRTELRVQSAAIRIERTEELSITPYYDDLRVDASETPIVDMKETIELATESFEASLERYEEAYDEDDDAGM